MSLPKPDVVSVGDIVTDAFIRLFEENGHTYTNENGDWLAMPFGTKIPFDYVEEIAGVGNAANAAVSFARLGLHSAFVTNVGDDHHGHDMIRSLRKNKVDTRLVHVNDDKISNYHYVLWYKDERTILIKHEEYDYFWPHLTPKETPEWIYFSSISKNALDFHDELAEWLDRHDEVKLAFQPGTFQIEAGAHRLHKLYKRADVLVVNREEAVQIGGGNHGDVHDIMNKLHELGPKIVAVTDGPDGAYASDGQQRFKMPVYPDPKPPFERTGAGDAFTSTFIAALIKGNTIEGALQWAPINSMSVVQQVGAQKGLLNEQELGELLKKAPEWYKPTRF